jgi:aldehyde dehydrogenase (NAD+)
METWHPLGVVGIISAFNFPVAVWSWNAALALVCGDAVVWKPSEKTPLTACATQAIFERAAAKFGGVPTGLSTLLIGGAALGEQIVNSPLVPLVSATGSTAMGRNLALRAIAFSAMGTAGQRCTTLRRLIVHKAIYDTLVPRLKQVYAAVTIGDPRDAGTLVGPLIDERAYINMQRALEEARTAGATVTGGERVFCDSAAQAFFVRPALVEISAKADVVKHETFAPILYVMRYNNFSDALAIHNDVPQGLSSCVFTMDLREAELFLSVAGSDCGIANVNIGTSGAEIGGAFGGEKETGGGRESGSDAWKQYMRRATNTINYGTDLPLAQGVSFDIDD